MDIARDAINSTNADSTTQKSCNNSTSHETLNFLQKLNVTLSDNLLLIYSLIKDLS